jgi:RND family efflux transporter MFP subunit
MKFISKNLILRKPVITFSLALLAAGCNSGSQQVTTQEAVIPEVNVQTVYTQSVEHAQTYTGTIAPWSRNMITTFQATMRIEKIMVEVGDYVREGQLLVQMEEANYLQAKMQIENLKVDYNRVSALYQSGGVSKQQLDQLNVQLNVAMEALANLEKNTFLKSPINGMVTMRNFDNGDLTGGQPILMVQQLNPLKVLINVQEVYFPLVKRGMSASVQLESYPGELFEGKVNLIYPAVDPISHTFTVEIVMNNSGMKVLPGMFARTTLNFGSRERVVIPDVAVVKQQGTNDRYVYILNYDGTVSYKRVELGVRQGHIYEVLSGITEGERIVTAGMSRLLDGVNVRVSE